MVVVVELGCPSRGVSSTHTPSLPIAPRSNKSFPTNWIKTDPLVFVLGFAG